MCASRWHLGSDLSTLNVELLKQFAQAGAFGEWRVSQLFVGSRATVGARSTLHFDHNDNLFLQIAGVKRFRLYPPSEGGNVRSSPRLATGGPATHTRAGTAATRAHQPHA